MSGGQKYHPPSETAFKPPLGHTQPRCRPRISVDAFTKNMHKSSGKAGLYGPKLHKSSSSNVTSCLTALFHAWWNAKRTVSKALHIKCLLKCLSVILHRWHISAILIILHHENNNVCFSFQGGMIVEANFQDVKYCHCGILQVTGTNSPFYFFVQSNAKINIPHLILSSPRA